MAYATLILLMVVAAIAGLMFVILVIKGGSNLVRFITALLLIAPGEFCLFGFFCKFRGRPLPESLAHRVQPSGAVVFW